VCTAQGVDDDADVMDLRWAYTRGPVLGGLASGRGLGSFSAQSTYGTIGELGYATRAVTNNSGRDGSISDGEGRTFGPVVADGGITSDTTDFGQALAVNDVPEPGSLALAGLGVVMAGLARRGKGRRQYL
jgi:hypothetical protein